MEFGLSLEQRQFDDSLRSFLTDRLPMERLRLARMRLRWDGLSMAQPATGTPMASTRSTSGTQTGIGRMNKMMASTPAPTATFVTGLM